MMFQTVGHRPRTQQRVRLGATPDGKLVSLQHDYVNHTSILDDYHEDCGEATPFHVQRAEPARDLRPRAAQRRLAHVDARPRRRARALRDRVGDERAGRSAQDRSGPAPRPERAEDRRGAEAFRSRRGICSSASSSARRSSAGRSATPEVGSMKRDGLTLGWGMAGCTWIAARFPAEASVELRDDGTARVACGTQDIGTGTYTILAQIAAEKTGVPLDKIEVVLGDTRFRRARSPAARWRPDRSSPPSSRRPTRRSQSLLTIATTTPGSPFEKRKPDELAFEGGRVFVKADGAGERRAVRRSAPARQRPAASPAAASRKATFGESEAEVLDAFLRLPLRRGHLAAGDRPAARQPRGDRDRRRPDPQPARRPQPDRGRGRDGHRHGAVRADARTTRGTARRSTATWPTTSWR